jgi:hypothetical protein
MRQHRLNAVIARLGRFLDQVGNIWAYAVITIAAASMVWASFQLPLRPTELNSPTSMTVIHPTG